jgi:hypothetical protein
MGKVEDRLASLGYHRLQRNNLERSLWVKGENTVRVVHSSEFETRYVKSKYVRVLWREEWKDYYAIIFDYSRGSGPTCILPVSVLFNFPFVKEKRKQVEYANNGYWWSQRFPVNHEMTQLVLSYKERWDLL